MPPVAKPPAQPTSDGRDLGTSDGTDHAGEPKPEPSPMERAAQAIWGLGTAAFKDAIHAVTSTNEQPPDSKTLRTKLDPNSPKDRDLVRLLDFADSVDSHGANPWGARLRKNVAKLMSTNLALVEQGRVGMNKLTADFFRRDADQIDAMIQSGSAHGSPYDTPEAAARLRRLANGLASSSPEVQADVNRIMQVDGRNSYGDMVPPALGDASANQPATKEGLEALKYYILTGYSPDRQPGETDAAWEKRRPDRKSDESEEQWQKRMEQVQKEGPSEQSEAQRQQHLIQAMSQAIDHADSPQTQEKARAIMADALDARAQALQAEQRAAEQKAADQKAAGQSPLRNGIDKLRSLIGIGTDHNAKSDTNSTEYLSKLADGLRKGDPASEEEARRYAQGTATPDELRILADQIKSTYTPGNDHLGASEIGKNLLQRAEANGGLRIQQGPGKPDVFIPVSDGYVGDYPRSKLDQPGDNPITSEQALLFAYGPRKYAIDQFSKAAVGGTATKENGYDVWKFEGMAPEAVAKLATEAGKAIGQTLNVDVDGISVTVHRYDSPNKFLQQYDALHAATDLAQHAESRAAALFDSDADRTAFMKLVYQRALAARPDGANQSLWDSRIESGAPDSLKDGDGHIMPMSETEEKALDRSLSQRIDKLRRAEADPTTDENTRSYLKAIDPELKQLSSNIRKQGAAKLSDTDQNMLLTVTRITAGEISLADHLPLDGHDYQVRQEGDRKVITPPDELLGIHEATAVNTAIDYARQTGETVYLSIPEVVNGGTRVDIPPIEVSPTATLDQVKHAIIIEKLTAARLGQLSLMELDETAYNKSVAELMNGVPVGDYPLENGQVVRVTSQGVDLISDGHSTTISSTHAAESGAIPPAQKGTEPVAETLAERATRLVREQELVEARDLVAKQLGKPTATDDDIRAEADRLRSLKGARGLPGAVSEAIALFEKLGLI